MFFDSHAHLNFKSFEDADKVIKSSLGNDTWMINVGSQLYTSKRAVELSKNYNGGVYSAVGLHPVHISESEIIGDEDPKEKYAIKDLGGVISEIKKLTQNDKVVAIGEVGLDYFHFPKNCDIEKIKEWQKLYLIEFIKLAIELDKPLILHCRSGQDDQNRAYEDMLDILNAIKNIKLVRGVIHCFGANLEIAKQFIGLGFKIGFTGIVTFKNAKDLQSVASDIDLQNILIETDSPYLAPNPFRGKRNEPIYVKYIAQKIAEIKKIDYKDVEKTTFDNTIKLFNN